MKRIIILSTALFFILFEAYAIDSWVLKNFPDSVTINGLEINSSNEIFVIAGYLSDEDEACPVGVVYHSNDDGNNWTQIITPEWFPEILDILIDNEDNIYLGTWYGGVYKSENNGVTWEAKGDGLSNSVPVFLSISSEGVLYAGQFWGGGIDYSLNGGNEWSQTNHPSNSGIKGLGVGINDYVFSDGGLYSPDGGVSWHYNNVGLSDYTLLNQVCYAFNQTNEVYLGSVEGIYYLSTVASSWEKILSTEGYVLDIIISSQNKIYAATNEDVFISNNNGQDWDNISNQFISTTPQKFCFDNEGYLWAVSRNEIYKSQNVLTGFPENTVNQNNVRASPNPFKENLLIDFPNKLQDGESISIYIFGIDGKLQKSINEKVFDNQILISLKNLTAGKYIIKFDLRGLNITSIIVIKE